MSAVSAPAFVKDARGLYVFANEPYASLLGHRPEDLLGRADEFFLGERKAAARRSAFEEALNAGFAPALDEDFTDATGLRRHVTLRHRAFVTPHGGRFVIGLAQDTTALRLAEDALRRAQREVDVLRQMRAYDGERLRRLEAELSDLRRLDEALRRSEERYALAVEGSKVGIWELDLKSDSVYFSPQWKRMLGYREDEVPGALDEWTGRLHPEDRAGVLEALNAYLEGRATEFERTYRMRHKDGGWRWILTRAVVFLDERKGLQRLAGSNVDVTAQKQLEEHLKDVSARLERSNVELEQFAYTASHDLKEPLRKMLSFGERLQGSPAAMGEREKDFLTRMQDAGRRMHSLIENLLTFSKAAVVSPAAEDIDLADVVRDVVQDLELRIAECRAVVEVGPLPRARASRDAVRQVLQNLVSNALKFCRPDATPTVRIEGRDAPDGFVEVSVTDNGLGFDDKDAERIFRPFQRLHAHVDGNGIGLATCQKLVERLGGRIHARGTPGVGARFLILLPAAASLD